VIKDVFDTDLACERRRAVTDEKGVSFERQRDGIFVWERIKITSKEGEGSIGRPMGKYHTLHTERIDRLTSEDKKEAVNTLGAELSALLQTKKKKENSRFLFVGLGNRSLTADAVGPLCADRVRATFHIAENDARFFAALDCAKIGVIAPGVSMQTGFDTFFLLESVCHSFHPDFVIAVDSLAARDVDRLGRTVQISDTGIFPGSGVGNTKTPLTKETLGIPVIAIGVPTVTSLKAFASSLPTEKRKEDFDAAKYADMFVSPSGIDDIVKTASEIISNAVNGAIGIKM